MPFDPKRPFKVINATLLKEYVKSEPKGLTADEIISMVADQIKRIPKVAPQRVIERIVEKQIVKEEKKETREFAESKTVDDLKNEIEDLKKQLKDSMDKVSLSLSMMGGSGVIGLPKPDGNAGKTIQVVNNQWVPVTPSSGSGGLTPGTFTISNNTPTYSFDATGATVDTLYQIVATLVRTLQGEI